MECTFDDGIFFVYIFGEPFLALPKRVPWGEGGGQSYTLSLFQMTMEGRDING